jgi:hypothetical protein
MLLEYIKRNNFIKFQAKASCFNMWKCREVLQAFDAEVRIEM